MITHNLKIDTKFFDDVKSGKKNFEIRKNDRDFQVGDILKLKAFDCGAYQRFNDEILTYFDCKEQRADTITAKVISILSSEKWNIYKDFTDPLIFEEKMEFKYGLVGVSKVTKEYFGSDYVPDGYVVMKIEVI